MKKILYLSFFLFVAQNCFGQSKPLDLSVTLSDLNNYQLSSQKGQASGYAPLDSNSIIPAQFLFPGFSSSQNGTIWSKSGSSWSAISNLNIQSSGIVASLVRIGQLSIPGSSSAFGIGTELNNIPLILYGGNGKVYVSSGQTIGAADVGLNNFTWSINSSGNFDLNGGIIKGGLSMNGSSISNVSSINTASGMSINFTNNRIVSLVSGKDIIFSGNNIGVQVPNINTNDLNDPNTSTIAKSYALNMNSADLFYASKNNTNTWTFPQTFLSGIIVSPAISISSGGTGATNAAQARQNLGITTGTTNGFQAWSPILANLSTNTPINNNFMMGSVSGNNATWLSRTPEQVKTILGLNFGANGVQPYSTALQYISSIVTNNIFNSRYFIMGDSASSSLIARSIAQTRSDLGLEINSTNGVQAYSVYLRDISNLGVPQTNEFLVGNGTTWVKRSSTQTREILSAQPANATLSNVSSSSYIGDDNISLLGNITNGTWNGTTISIQSGGTGATNQSNARSNLGLSANWLTNTSVSNFRSDIGLSLQILTNTSISNFIDQLFYSNKPLTYNSSNYIVWDNPTNDTLYFSNSVAFNSSVVFGVGTTSQFNGSIFQYNGDDVFQLFSGSVMLSKPLNFSSDLIKTNTRINLGLGANWLTNTNVATFRSDIGLGSAATNLASAFQPASSILTNLSSGNGSSVTNVPASGLTGVLSISQGGTGANNASSARSGLGLSAAWLTNTSVATFRSDIGLGASWLTNNNATNFRSDIGLGSAATNPSSAFQPSSSALTNLSSNNGGFVTNLNANNISSGTLPINRGGTGATNQETARTNLGLGNGLNATIVFRDDFNSQENTIVISNGIIISWTQN